MFVNFGIYLGRRYEFLDLTVDFIPFRPLYRRLKARKRLIPHNPARDADPPRYSTDGREYAVLSQDDVAAFFEAAKGDRFEALFVLSVLTVLTGMRPAEARALRWRDIDARRGEATVHRSVVELRGEPPKIRDWTKTRKNRVVPLLPPVVAALNAHKARQNEKKLALGGLWEDDTIVFPTTRGGVMAGRNLSRWHLKPVLRKAGLSEAARLYDLRHTFATLWSDSGEATEVLSKLIGHARTSTTSDFYIHPNDRARREAMGRFGGLWE